MIAFAHPTRVCYLIGSIRNGVRIVVASRCGKAPTPVAPAASSTLIALKAR